MADSILVDLSFMEYACNFPCLESLLEFCTTAFLEAFSADPDPDQYLTEFISLFARVLKAYPDPPLEAVWFFSALTLREDPDDIPYILHDLYTFTASSPAAAKPLALLAPVVSELFHSKNPRSLIERLVGAVLRYINTCCSRPARGEVNADVEELLPVFRDLVKVSTVRKRGTCPFQVLFPLVGEEDRQDLKKDGCSVAFLAGVVVAEAYLLMLCLKVQGAAGVPRSERQKKLSKWASSSILAFKNQQFFGVLLNTLINFPLRGCPLLNADDETLVRDVLYDVLIWSDDSVLSGAEVDQAESSLFPFIVSSLVVIVDTRREGDQGCTNAFPNIRRYITSWASGDDQLGKPIASTPEALLKWLEDKKLYSRIKAILMHDDGQSRTSQSDADPFVFDKKSRQE